MCRLAWGRLLLAPSTLCLLHSSIQDARKKKKKTTVTMNPLVNRRLSSISPVFHGLFRILCTGCPILALCKAGRALTAHKYCSTAIPLIYSSSFIFILDYCFSYPVMKRVSFSSPHFMSHLHSLSC